jgi:ankyrin repeat protein
MLLNKLKETKIDKIVITTRPHLKKELEKRFNTISYELSTFNEENQEVFLKKYWKRNLKFDVVDDEKLKLFSTHILSLISFSLRDKERKLMGIPLQTRMLAEVYEDDFKNFHQTKVKKHNLPNSLNSLELYRIFINKKYEIYLKEKLGLKLEIPGGEETQRTLKYSFDEQHKFIAMKVIFDNTKLMPEKNNFDEVSLLRVGIVEKLNGKATFIHRTFAEYFAIDWMAENLYRNDVKKILAERIFNDHGEVMRNFFDRKLAIQNKMIKATLNNDEVTLKALLKKPLQKNTKQKNLKKNKRIAQGQPAEDQQGRTALHLAASYGFDNIVNLLILNDAKINAVDNLFSWTPLQYAANACEWGTVNLLLNKGANYLDLENINFLKSKIHEKTALHIASFRNYQALVEAIFKIYDLNENQLEKIIFARDEEDHVCLHSAVSGENSEIFDLVLDIVEKKFGIEKLNQFVNSKNSDQDTPLHWAGRTLDIRTLDSKVHIKNSLKLAYRAKNRDGWTALHEAAHCGKFDNVKVFVEHDLSSVYVIDKYKRTSLHEAAYGEFSDKAEEYCKIVNFLLDNGSKINAQDIDGFTALHSATRCGHLNIVEILIRRGAKINIVDNFLGITPFYIAVLYGHLEIVKFLLDNNAMIDVEEGLSGASKIKALHLASILPESLNQGIDIFKLLLKNNCDINAKANTSPKFFEQLSNYILRLPYVDRHPLIKYFRKNSKLFSKVLPTAEFTAYDIASWLGNDELIKLIMLNGGISAGNWLIDSGLAKMTIGLLIRRYRTSLKKLLWPSNLEETHTFQTDSFIKSMNFNSISKK